MIVSIIGKLFLSRQFLLRSRKLLKFVRSIHQVCDNQILKADAEISQKWLFKNSFLAACFVEGSC